ncbi:hypothetical protein RB195_008758 [Necator americanus]|uniref:Uncharacterized protein n=1 Tax=Necator americanus TaxID=51031 RepID=A0ABR1CQ57_NECAM
MSRLKTGLFVLLALTLTYLFLEHKFGRVVRLRKWNTLLERNKNFSKNDSSKKWIVVTTVHHPAEDIKRLSRIPNWTLVVVGDIKTPKDWYVEGAHFLSVEDQEKLGYRIMGSLPYNSYARKNIGYLYAIANGAEWIYDTDDDNKPFGLGLEQFEYSNETSGLRYGCSSPDETKKNKKFSSEKLFNPYSFFGNADMWPRGFPIEYIQSHTNGPDRYCLCHRTRTAVVQQGLVHKDPDVDAIYRLLHANKMDGLDEKFNRFTPPVTLSRGTYAPWNSQNTLFHRRAFFTLALPAFVQFRVTDIWRSYFAQKLLHIIGENIAFYPANAIQVRNSHDFLKDFRSERDMYKDSGKLLKFLDEWKCNDISVDKCVLQLAKAFRYEFPPPMSADEYTIPPDENFRGVNCRRVEMEFLSERVNLNEGSKRSELKIRMAGDISDWCAAANHTELLHMLPSPEQLNDAHTNHTVLTDLENTVLVVTYNYPMNGTIGLIQRLYQPYFGVTIFCGSWFPKEYDQKDFPKILHPLNYIHLSKHEMNAGYFAYYCLSKVKDLLLQNVLGYFVMADDTTFNFWHSVDLNSTVHSIGISAQNESGIWWPSEMGMTAVKKARTLFEEKYKNDAAVQAVWKQYADGLASNMMTGVTASEHLTTRDGWSMSDLYYIPAHLLDYHAGLMEIFFEANVFHEIAISKYLYTVPHQGINYSSNSSVRLFQDLMDFRGLWANLYYADLIGLHPIKFSEFVDKMTRKRVMSRLSTGFLMLLSLTVVFLFVEHILGPIGGLQKWPTILVRSKIFQKNSNSKKWIVVTTVQHPTEEIKRLSRIPNWALVVVADVRTPKDWYVEGAHFLSIEDQKKLGYRIMDSLPYNSYARKNIGYLYAIANGAEWIYDTDDDKKPYGLGLEQFEYSNETSGLRYGCRPPERKRNNFNEKFSSEKLFNPYSFFGNVKMWPRGFPIEHIQSHTNGAERSCLCHQMRTPIVQQGLVHRDSDLYALYRASHADEKDRVDVKFNRFTPPVTLASGIYAPWNSQNTLFHRRAFFTLALPVSVPFRATDIWRSYFAQKLLHVIGENIAFYPANAIQLGNSHDLFSDFRTERDYHLYKNFGNLLRFLDDWNCNHKSLDKCVLKLAEEFSAKKFWGKTDVALIRKWIEDLHNITYEFPSLNSVKEYAVSSKENFRGANCRRARVQFHSERVNLNEDGRRSKLKIRSGVALSNWCAAANYSEILHILPSPRRVNNVRARNNVLKYLEKTVLVVTYNYPMNGTIGLIQRLYQPYFGVTIFCGSWFSREYYQKAFPKVLHPFNYIHLSKHEMNAGYFAYYCLSKVKDLLLQNVLGYFVMADDTTFNFWHSVDLNSTMHSIGIRPKNASGPWWPSESGMVAVKRAKSLFEEKYKNDAAVQAVWKQYGDGLASNMKTGMTASEHLTTKDGWSMSDLYYIPSSLLDYHAGLMEIFFEANIFHEIAISKYLYTVPHQVISNSTNSTNSSTILFENLKEDRSIWDKKYNEHLSNISGWSVAIVGGSKTCKNCSTRKVHFLSIEDQSKLGYRIHEILPRDSYARKNIGYLYAIKNGAEWIYDAGDDITISESDLEKFAYSEETSGLRYGCRSPGKDSEEISTAQSSIAEQLFNPYAFYGRPNIWPRGFPVEYKQDHIDMREHCCLCHKMRTPAIQQGLIHDDIDPITRIDGRVLRDDDFNQIAPPVILDSGIYGPLNSRNTLFHRRAFFTLFLPVSVKPRVMETIRSYFAQKLLHIIGENIALHPANAVQMTTSNDQSVPKTLKSDDYLELGQLLRFLQEWRCTHENITRCTTQLAHEFRAKKFWNSIDTVLVTKWIEDLQSIGYEFPSRVDDNEYQISQNEDSRGDNCRQASVEILSMFSKLSEVDSSFTSKLTAFTDLAEWCARANSPDLRQMMHSSKDYNHEAGNSSVLTDLQSTALIITFNYPINKTIGVLQRMYQPYFGITIFCGSWYPKRYDENGFPRKFRPFNYVHLSENEAYQGFFIYYCLSKVKEMRLTNVQGYFVMADDLTFNFWHQMDLKKTMHVSGTGYINRRGRWTTIFGLHAASAAVQLFEEKYKNDAGIQAAWNQFRHGLESEVKEAVNPSAILLSIDGWTISDLFYIPSYLLEYYSNLMEVFFEAGLFHEIAINKFLYTVPHTRFNISRFHYLLEASERSTWYKNYSASLISLHPIKLSQLYETTFRKQFCNTVLSAFWSNLLRAKANKLS